MSQVGDPVELSFESMEEIRQDRQHRRPTLHQGFHLEGLNGAHTQEILIGVQEPPVGTAQGVGLQGLPERI